MDWQPIETAPREAVFRADGSEYGPWILAAMRYGEVRRVRWWQSVTIDPQRFRNFLGDCGNAFYPTHWMPLPEPPKE